MNHAPAAALFGTLVQAHEVPASRGFVARPTHGAISGRVTAIAGGAPVPGARLVLRPLAPAAAPQAHAATRVLDADDEGCFIGTRLEPGRWCAQVSGGAATELRIRAGETVRISLVTTRPS